MWRERERERREKRERGVSTLSAGRWCRYGSASAMLLMASRSSPQADMMPRLAAKRIDRPKIAMRGNLAQFGSYLLEHV